MELPDLKELTAISLTPSEVLVVTVPATTTTELVQNLADALRSVLPFANRVLIVTDEIKFFKLSELEAEKLKDPPEPEIPLTDMEQKVWGNDGNATTESGSNLD
jgi:hypothetical protein